MMDLLRIFVDSLNGHGIEYFISLGTLIGSVRHHGIIPWDDDIGKGCSLLLFAAMGRKRMRDLIFWGNCFFWLYPIANGEIFRKNEKKKCTYVPL